ncbi:peptidase S10 [bacterium]|nr:peptidase S10 [bacterium]
MKNKRSLFVLPIIFIVFFLSILSAEEAKKENLYPPPSVTKHSIQIGEKTLDYTATAGTLPLRENRKTTAHVFYIAYTKDGVQDKSERPILFSFNGGPGSSSVWLHMGFLGPRRVLYDEKGFALPPPYKLVDNEYSILDTADIVFIDPVGTGYSRMVPGKDKHKYHGVMQDIQSVAEFIRLYISRNERWESPKFIIGESYGTTRASGLVGYLQSRHNMYFNGVILVSMTELGVNAGKDLNNYMLKLPHYAATAWYHKQLSPEFQKMDLKELLNEVEEFAMNEYILALVQGNRLSPEKRNQIASRLARYTGLSVDFIKNSNLRIDKRRFRKELLRDENRTVGRLDSRYKGIDKDASGERQEYDPAMAHWSGGFTGALNQYIREELKYKTDLNYHIFGDVRPWKGRDEVQVGEMLRRALTQNEYLQVFVLEGYYDAACDYFTAQYTFSHLDLNGELKDRIHFGFYKSGHMMYIHKPSLIKGKKDIASFINKAVQD